MWDIQGAIWYFISMAGNYSPPSSVSRAMIKDALANGAGFVPAETQLLAVVCYPTTVVPTKNDTQISIIEVTIPKSSPTQTLAVIAGTAAIATIALLLVLKKRKK
jgi:LPXTG-motif cell wall-anchored protein